MPSGTVKRTVPERGFGFISDASGTEYFFHRSNVDNFDSLRGGESVTFEVEDGPKGPRANQVRLAADAPAAEAPVAEAPAAEAPAAEAPAAEAPEAEAPVAEAPEAEAPSAEAPEAEAPTADAAEKDEATV